eukprot:758575-Ditylum_brightwellii.AAC.1
MVIDDFGPTLVYVKGESNAAADAVSRLETKELNWFEEGTRDLHAIAKRLADIKEQINWQLNKKVFDLITLAKYYWADTSDDEVYQQQFRLIQAEQQKDKHLLEKARVSSDNYQVKDFLGCRKKHHLICLNDMIVVPKGLQSKIVNWYHFNLYHPG